MRVAQELEVGKMVLMSATFQRPTRSEDENTAGKGMAC
jgi:hypothetical protein